MFLRLDLWSYCMWSLCVIQFSDCDHINLYLICLRQNLWLIRSWQLTPWISTDFFGFMWTLQAIISLFISYSSWLSTPRNLTPTMVLFKTGAIQLKITLKMIKKISNRVPTGDRTSNLQITSPTLCDCATESPVHLCEKILWWSAITTTLQVIRLYIFWSINDNS